MSVTVSNQAYWSVTGPVLLYWAGVNTTAFGQALNSSNYSGFNYLGTTVRSPKVSTDNAYEPAMNAIGGVSNPTEMSFQGTMATIQCPMNRVSESSLRALKALPYYNAAGTSSIANQDAGTWQFQDMGALTQQDGAAFMLVMVYPYPANNGPAGLQNGKRFYCCVLPKDEEDDMVTVPKVDVLMINATLYRGAFALNGAFVDAKYTLFDYAVPTLAAGSFPLPT